MSRGLEMSESKKIDELISYSRELYGRKLIHATGGNTSVREGDHVWISQTGAELGGLSVDEIVKVDLQGNVLEGTGPSKEMGMHLAMFRARENAGAAIHAHPTFSIARSAMLTGPVTDSVPPYTAAFYVRAGKVPMVEYHASGAHSLHEAVVALAADYHALLLRQHGLLVAGGSMADALGIVEEIEQCCQIAVATGGSAAGLTEEQRRAIDTAMGRSWK
jgi:ribulose-5-phosphate 4-epimerase/fuculose-1-phosphate aldolase